MIGLLIHVDKVSYDNILFAINQREMIKERHVVLSVLATNSCYLIFYEAKERRILCITRNGNKKWDMEYEERSGYT